MRVLIFHDIFHRVFLIESNKSKAPRSVCILVYHNDRVLDLPIGIEVVMELFFSNIMLEPSHENLICSTYLIFIIWCLFQVFIRILGARFLIQILWCGCVFVAAVALAAIRTVFTLVISRIIHEFRMLDLAIVLEILLQLSNLFIIIIIIWRLSG